MGKVRAFTPEEQETWWRLNDKKFGGGDYSAPEPFTDLEIKQWNTLWPRWWEMKQAEDTKKRRRELLLLPVMLLIDCLRLVLLAVGRLSITVAEKLSAAIEWITARFI